MYIMIIKKWKRNIGMKIISFFNNLIKIISNKKSNSKTKLRKKNEIYQVIHGEYPPSLEQHTQNEIFRKAFQHHRGLEKTHQRHSQSR